MKKLAAPIRTSLCGVLSDVLAGGIGKLNLIPMEVKSSDDIPAVVSFLRDYAKGALTQDHCSLEQATDHRHCSEC